MAHPSIVGYGHLFVDEDGISRQRTCQLTEFERKAIQPSVRPQWQGTSHHDGATVMVTVLPVGWTGAWHENPKPQWIIPLSGLQSDYEGGRRDSEQEPAPYRLDPTTGALTAMADDFGGPNGLVFSPDETRLYVSETGDQTRPQELRSSLSVSVARRARARRGAESDQNRFLCHFVPPITNPKMSTNDSGHYHPLYSAGRAVRPSSTILIFSSAEYCLCVARGRFLTRLSVVSLDIRTA